MKEKATIVVIEDEENIAYVVSLALRSASFLVETAKTGMEGLARAHEHPRPDLMVLDVMLPDMTGFEVCRKLRQDNCDVPILFLTARDAPADRVHGLTIGADDYLTKPFSIDELVARVQAILRRTGRAPSIQVLHCRDVNLNDETHVVMRADCAVVLSPTEYKLLRFLMRNAGHVVSKAQIFDHLWNYDLQGRSTVVETHLSALRKKLGYEGQSLIQTVRGFGYRMNND